MTARSCAREGCDNMLEHMGSRARYCSNGCRTAAYKDRKGIVGYKPVKASQNGRRGGAQLSYRKVLNEIQALADRGVLAQCQVTGVQAAMGELLPMAQRSSFARAMADLQKYGSHIRVFRP